MALQSLQIVSSFSAIPSGPGIGWIQGQTATLQGDVTDSVGQPVNIDNPDVDIAATAEFFTAGISESGNTITINSYRDFPPLGTPGARPHQRLLVSRVNADNNSVLDVDIPPDLWPEPIAVAETSRAPIVVVWVEYTRGDASKIISEFKLRIRRGPMSGRVEALDPNAEN